MLRNKTAQTTQLRHRTARGYPAQQIQNAPKRANRLSTQATHTHHVRRSAARRHMASHRIHTRTTRQPDRTTHGRSRLETFYFFVPNRITWEQYWEQFITGSDDSLVIPTIKPVENGVGFAVLSGGVFDHFGNPPQVHNHRLRAQRTAHLGPTSRSGTNGSEIKTCKDPWTWGTWGTVQQSNSSNKAPRTGINPACAPTNGTTTSPRACRGHRKETPWSSHWAQTAPVMTNATEIVTGAQAGMLINRASDGAAPALAGYPLVTLGTDAHQVTVGTSAAQTTPPTHGTHPTCTPISQPQPPSPSTAIRLAFQTQKLLERDARGGSRLCRNNSFTLWSA